MKYAENTQEHLKKILPQLAQFQGKRVVIKYGGNAMLEPALKRSVLADIAALQMAGIQPVICHGGGPDINRMLTSLNIPTKFVNGLRYTSREVLDVVKAVLIGQVNSELVGILNHLGGQAVGLSGISGNIFQCVKQLGAEDLGFVGEIRHVGTRPITTLMDAGYIPVIAPVGTDGAGTHFNINGDLAASKLASALGAEKLILLTDIEGLCNDVSKRDVIPYLDVGEVPRLKERGVISGGMIPKIDGCVQAIEQGVGQVHIIDGRKPHSLLTDIFSSQSGGTVVGKGDAIADIRPAI